MTLKTCNPQNCRLSELIFKFQMKILVLRKRNFQLKQTMLIKDLFAVEMLLSDILEKLYSGGKRILRLCMENDGTKRKHRKKLELYL